MIVPSILSCLCLAAALRNQRPEALLEEPLTAAAASKRLQELRDMGPIDAALAYDWPEILEANFAEGFELFRALVESEDWIVRQGVAQSTAWTALLKQSPAQGMAMSRMLVEDEQYHVRTAAAEYLAWPALLKQNFNEGLALVQKLVEDKHFSVRARAAKYFPWPTLLKENLMEGLALFRKLVADDYSSVKDAATREEKFALQDYWLSERIQDLGPQELVALAKELQFFAGDEDVMDGLVTWALKDRIDLLTNETLLRDLAKVPIMKAEALRRASFAINPQAGFQASQEIQPEACPTLLNLKLVLGDGDPFFRSPELAQPRLGGSWQSKPLSWRGSSRRRFGQVIAGSPTTSKDFGVTEFEVEVDSLDSIASSRCVCVFFGSGFL